MAERPRIYVEPPVPTATEFSTVDQVRNILYQHLAGRFRMSALLAERMLWNVRLRGVVGTRLAGLLSAEVRFEPARENRDARRAAREFAEDWPYMATAPVRKQFRKWAWFLGVSFAQRALQISPVGGRQIYRLRPYWPGFCNWYWAEGGYRIQTYDVGVVDAKSPGLRDIDAPSPTMTGLINPSEQPWVIDEPNGDDSWRDALLFASWRPWLGHEWGFRDGARASEKHGIGQTKAYYPRGEGDEHKSAVGQFTGDLRTGAEGIIPLERRKNLETGEDEGFDIEPFEFNGSGFDAIDRTITTCAIALAVLWLGHNLTTEVKSGGSYAAAGVGEYIRDDIKHDDAESEWAVFGPQLARPYCLLNYGDPDLAPRARYVTDSAAVNQAQALMMNQQAQAIQTLRLCVPTFDVEAYCERLRIPLLAKGSVQIPAPPANDNQTPPSSQPKEDARAVATDARLAKLEARLDELEEVAA